MVGMMHMVGMVHTHARGVGYGHSVGVLEKKYTKGILTGIFGQLTWYPANMPPKAFILLC